MRLLISVVLFCAGLASPSEAGSKRTPVQGSPLLAGRPVEQLVLLQTIHVHHSQLPRALSRESWILPGQFVPVSEDSAGVYFQGLNGQRVFAGNREPQWTPGGLYLDKTRADRVYPYWGDARNSNEALDVDGFSLKKASIAQLKLAHSERKK
jgi:hypothetical protein